MNRINPLINSGLVKLEHLKNWMKLN